MTESQLPSNVHVFRPRAQSLSDRLDQFLEKHSLAPDEAPVRCDPTRPKSPGINAIKCASCGQAEYITRDYCRCGHYLRGQLEDEYLAWERKVYTEHDELLEAIERKLGPLRILFCLGLPFAVLPLLYLTFFSGSFSLSLLLWMAPAFLIFGLVALVERHWKQPLEASAWLVNHCTLETYLDERNVFSERPD